MKIYSGFAISQGQVPDELHKELRQMYPETREPGSILAWKIEKGDIRLTKILKRLYEYGYRPQLHQWQPLKNKYYRFNFYREYESKDFNSARLLIPGCTNNLMEGSLSRAPVGDTTVSYEEIKSANMRRPLPEGWSVVLSSQALTKAKKTGVQLGWAGLFTMVVSDTLRHEMQSVGLRHIQFKPVCVGTLMKYEEIEDYWEMFSEYTLPPVSTTELRKLRYTGSNAPFDGDCSKPVLPDEGFFSTVEIHYRAADLEQCDAFDLARPKEKIVNYKLIASKHFYDYCTSQNLGITWTPVRVDP